MPPMPHSPHPSWARAGVFSRARTLTLALLVLTGLEAAPPALAAEAPLPLFDAHLHYSHDAWERLPPKQAVALMRQAGLKRAMVSSSSDEGTQLLFAEAPDLVLPVLRPYRTRGEISTWLNDSTVVAHLEQRLAKYRYVAIGEYHVFGADADGAVMRRVVQLARQHGLALHSHSDADAIDRQFKQDPQARILWAHAGFDTSEKVREMLRKYPRLSVDLAYRSDHAPGGRLDPAWRAVMLELPDRFMLGTDTFTPERWYYVGEHARLARQWLAELPREVAERIASGNGERLFGPAAAALKKALP